MYACGHHDLAALVAPCNLCSVRSMVGEGLSEFQTRRVRVEHPRSLINKKTQRCIRNSSYSLQEDFGMRGRPSERRQVDTLLTLHDLHFDPFRLERRALPRHVLVEQAAA